MVHMAILDPDMPDVKAAREAREAQYLEFVRALNAGETPIDTADDTVTVLDAETGLSYTLPRSSVGSGGTAGGGGLEAVFINNSGGFWTDTGDWFEHTLGPDDLNKSLFFHDAVAETKPFVVFIPIGYNITPDDSIQITFVRSGQIATLNTLMILNLNTGENWWGPDTISPTGSYGVQSLTIRKVIDSTDTPAFVVSRSVGGVVGTTPPDMVQHDVDFDIVHETESVILVNNPDDTVVATLGVLSDTKTWEVTIIAGPQTNVTVGVVEGFFIDGVADGTFALGPHETVTFIGAAGAGWYVKSFHSPA
jgi:hypothetical protein